MRSSDCLQLRGQSLSVVMVKVFGNGIKFMRLYGQENSSERTIWTALSSTSCFMNKKRDNPVFCLSLTWSTSVRRYHHVIGIGCVHYTQPTRWMKSLSAWTAQLTLSRGILDVTLCQGIYQTGRRSNCSISPMDRTPSNSLLPQQTGVCITDTQHWVRGWRIRTRNGDRRLSVYLLSNTWLRINEIIWNLL